MNHTSRGSRSPPAFPISQDMKYNSQCVSYSTELVQSERKASCSFYIGNLIFMCVTNSVMAGIQYIKYSPTKRTYPFQVCHGRSKLYRVNLAIHSNYQVVPDELTTICSMDDPPGTVPFNKKSNQSK